MGNPAFLSVVVVIAVLTLSWQVQDPWLAFAADQQSPSTAQSKALTSLGEQKLRTADTAAKSKACFGVAPQIAKLAPDEGKPGVRVTITGTQFGSPECVRGVSFGPGQSADFAMGNESTIVATVPTGSRKGLVLVTITTASGEDSKPFLIK